MDAGSTGSRSFLFKIFSESGKKNINSTKIMEITPGLSEFYDRPELAVDYLIPVFQKAAELIPIDHHLKTAIYVQGTAGMRLLPDEVQEQLWDTLVDRLKTHPSNPFPIDRSKFGTINGFMEAYYAVISSNFIANTIDTDLM